MLARRTRPCGVWALSPFDDLQREIGRFFGDVWGERECLLSCNVDVREDADHLYIEAEVPGLTKDDIEITLENGVMAIHGKKKIEREEKDQNFHLHERRSGEFRRAFQLPTLVDENHVQAVLKDGVLTVTLNKREEVKPKRVEVKVL